MDIPYDLVIPLLGSHPNNTKTLIWKDFCMPIIITTLSTVAKLGNQSKCSLDNWLKKLWYNQWCTTQQFKKVCHLPQNGWTLRWLIRKWKINIWWFHSSVEHKTQKHTSKTEQKQILHLGKKLLVTRGNRDRGGIQVRKEM